MFGRVRANESFQREVALEVSYLTQLHGAEALRIAREKAARPNIRTVRRKVLEAAVRELENPAGAEPRRLRSLFGS